MIKKTTNMTRKIKKRILAIPAAATAIPVNPKSAAMIDTMKKIIAHLSMMRLHEVICGISWNQPSGRRPLFANWILKGRLNEPGYEAPKTWGTREIWRLQGRLGQTCLPGKTVSKYLRFLQ
jgi:hypothetical protein